MLAGIELTIFRRKVLIKTFMMNGIKNEDIAEEA